MSIFVQYKAGGQIVGGMFALATVLSAWIAFLLNIPLEQDYIFEIGLIIGSISSIFVIFEVHTIYLMQRFKEKKILETIYFRDLQDKIGGLFYFIPATLLFILLISFHPFPESYKRIKFIIIIVGFIVSGLEIWTNLKTHKTLSDRIRRVKLFFNILEDSETRMWGIPAQNPKSGRTPLIKTVLDALASKNWPSFEIVEQNWKDETEMTLQAIKDHAKEFNNIWEEKLTYIHQQTNPLKQVRDRMKTFYQDLSLYLESLWAAGFYLYDSINFKKYEFINEVAQRVNLTGRSYIKRLITILASKWDSERPVIKNYMNNTTILEFLGIEVIFRADEVHQANLDRFARLRKEISVLNSSEIEDFFINLKIASKKLEEIDKDDSNKDEWEFKWNELPNLFR